MGTAPVLVLDVTTIDRERPSVRIRTKAHPDGELFELRGEDDLGIVAAQRLQTLFEQAQAMSAGGINSIEQAQQIEAWVDEMLDAAFHRPLDDETRGELSDQKKLQILQFFIDACAGWVGASKPGKTPATAPAPKRPRARAAAAAA